MKIYQATSMKIITLASIALLLVVSCGAPKGLTEVKGPFSGSSYEGSRRFFRATGSAESRDAETAKSKALLLAKQRLASFVQTQINQVAENYSAERQIADNLGDFSTRFQQITREVLSQTIVDIAVIGDKTFTNKSGNYVSYIALETKKKVVYEKLKELSLSRQNLTPSDKAAIGDMIDKAIKEAEDN
jgi:phosphoenolpyruvate-protein kinase (PTS system EI component)